MGTGGLNHQMASLGKRAFPHLAAALVRRRQPSWLLAPWRAPTFRSDKLSPLGRHTAAGAMGGWWDSGTCTALSLEVVVCASQGQMRSITAGHVGVQYRYADGLIEAAPTR